MSRQAISRWDTGAVQPLADSVKSLAQVFQVSTDYLLNDDLDDPTPLHPPQPAPPQEEPTPTRKHRKWLLALAALAAAAVLVLVTAAALAVRWYIKYHVDFYRLFMYAIYPELLVLLQLVWVLKAASCSAKRTS